MLKEKVVKFNDKEVYIGDFNYENFLVDNSLDKMKLCDLDNLKIWSHDFDNKTASVKKYEEVCMKKDDPNQNIDGLDSYCFNIFTLSLLLNQANFTTLRNIENTKLPEEFDNFENNEIIMDHVQVVGIWYCEDTNNKTKALCKHLAELYNLPLINIGESIFN
jgi:hypothetical protein